MPPVQSLYKSLFTINSTFERKVKMNGEAAFFSSLFILHLVTQSQKDHKLFSATYILCSKKLAIKR